MTICPHCSAVTARLHRNLRVLQAARNFIEGGAAHFGELQRAVRDGIARADSRTVGEQRREAEEMAARWRAKAEQLRASDIDTRKERNEG